MIGKLVKASSSSEVVFPNWLCAACALFFKLFPIVAINPPEIGMIAMAIKVSRGLMENNKISVPKIINGSRTNPSMPLSMVHSISVKSAVARVNWSPF